MAGLIRSYIAPICGIKAFHENRMSQMMGYLNNTAPDLTLVTKFKYLK